MKLRLPLLLLKSVLACFIFTGIGYASSIGINTTFSENITWSEATTISANNLELTFDEGVIVTQAIGGFNIGNNSLTLKGKGVLKVETEATVKIGGTLTIDGMTLDLSSEGSRLSGTESSTGYTTLNMVVKNGGTVKVDQFVYNGSFGASSHNQGLFRLDNGTIQFTNAGDSDWGYGMNILAGGGTVEAMTEGKTVTLKGQSGDTVVVNSIAQDSTLSFTGVGNFNAGTATNRLTGQGGIVKDGTGTLTIGVDQNFEGDVELKGGKLVVSSAKSLGAKGHLKVTGTGETFLEGSSVPVSTLTLNAGTHINVSKVDSNAGLTLNGKLALSGKSTMTGNLSLGRGNTLSIPTLPGSGEFLLTLDGTLKLEGGLLLETDSSVVWNVGDTYDFIYATSVTGSLGNFFLTNDVYGQWITEENMLRFGVFAVEFIEWAGGGDSEWKLNGSAETSPWVGKGIYTNGSKISFGNVLGSDLQTIEIVGNVAPVEILVNASSTNYEWSGAGSLSGVANLHKSGTSDLTINTDNADYIGKVTFAGGSIEIGTETALGSGDFLFDGGTLRYGSGVTKDVSGQIKRGDGLTNFIRVDTNGEGVTWENLKDKKMSITRSGEGSLLLTLIGGSYEGVYTNVGAGDFIITNATNCSLSGASAGLSGIITKRGDGELQIAVNSFNNSSGTLVVEQGGVNFVSNGTYSSKMNIHLKGKGTYLMVPNAAQEVTGTGTLTMGEGTMLTLKNAQNGTHFFAMCVKLDAKGSFATINGTIFGLGTNFTGSISGVGGLHLINNLNAVNTIFFKGGWLKNSYVGDTEILASNSTKFSSKFVWNGNGEGTTNGQKLTPWGTGNVTIGGAPGQDAQVIIENLTNGFDYSIDNAIVLKYSNGKTTTFNLLTTQTGKMQLKGVLTAEPGAAATTGKVVLNAGKHLELLGGLAGGGTLEINMATDSHGSLTIGSNNNTFTGNLTVANADKLYLKSESLINGSITTSGAAYVGENVQVVNSLSASSLGFIGSTLGTTPALTATTLTMTGSAEVVIDVDTMLSISPVYQLAQWTTFAGTAFGVSATLTGAFADMYTASLRTVNGLLSLNLQRAAGTNSWGGGSGTWGEGYGAGWQEGVNFDTDQKVFFGDLVGGDSATITIVGSVMPSSIVFANVSGAYTLTGGSIDNGTGARTSLTKDGAGTLIISMANNYSGGTFLKSGVVEMAHRSALGAEDSKIHFNGGSLKYGAGITTDISARIAEAVEGNDNTIRIDTNGNNISWATGITSMGYVKSGDGSLALTTADGGNYTQAIAIDGGSLILSRDAGSVTISGSISGNGTLVKEGVGNFYLTSPGNNFTGRLEIEGGTTVVGAASTSGGGRVASLGNTASIIVENGAAFRTHLGGGLVSPLTFTFGNAYIKSGGSFGNIDGHLNNEGNIHFNVTTIGADGTVSYNDSGSVELYQFYSKVVGFNGIISGSGTVNLVSSEKDGGVDHRFVLKNSGNTFNGTYVLASNWRTTIELANADTATGGVAQNAHFQLDHGMANLVISAGSASIASLEGTAGTVSAEGGDRTLVINQGDGDKVFAGILADTANGATGAKLSLEKDGIGKLTLDADNTYTGGTVIKNGSLVMGAGKSTALGTGSVLLQGGLLDMNGTAMANGLTISGGHLAGATSYAGADRSVDISSPLLQDTLNLGGLKASKVASISTKEAGTLVRGLGEGSLTLGSSSLAVGANNLFLSTGDVYPGETKSIVELTDASSTISMDSGSVLTLDLRDADLVTAMLDLGDQTYQILVTNGVLNMNNVSLTNAGDTFQLVDIDGGNVVISGDASNIYAVATNQNKSISSNDGLNSYNAILVNGILNLNLLGITGTDGLTLKNLNGKSSGIINVTQTGLTGIATVILNVTDVDSIYDGTLNGKPANFIKTGDGIQILGGYAEMNNLTVKEGDMEIKKGGELFLFGNTGKLESGTSLKGAGSLVLNGTFGVEGGASIDGVDVTLNGINSRLDLGNSNSSISGLNGDGVLNSDNGSTSINTVSGQTSVFEGRLTGAGSLNIGGAGSQSLVGAGSADFALSVRENASLHISGTSDVTGVSYKSLNVNSGKVIVEAMGGAVSDSNTFLNLASGGYVASGATLAFVVNTDYPGAIDSTSPSLIKTQGEFTLESGALVDVSSVDPNANLPEDATSDLSFVLIQGTNGGQVKLADGVNLKTSGLFDVYYEDTMLENINGDLVLVGKMREDNYFSAAGTTTNSSAAANLLWKNRRGLISTSELGKLMSSISEDIKSGNTGEATRAMAASVGSTVTSLLAAQRGSFRQQQSWIRNRTAQMGVNQGLVNEGLPYVNAWIQGNAGYNKLDESGDQSGYSLNTWGGTVGVDVDMNESFTFGLAATADYGKLKAKATDTARGDMDSYYLNLFTRIQRKNWGHTLIVSGAWTDSTLDRTVSYTGGGYTTRGSTNGTSFGAMYEGTYDIAMNDKKTSVFQPVVNAGIYSSRVDGYNETGADNAGLHVGKMDETYGSIAIGGRLMGIVGSNIFGRGALGEVRMMVSQDVGNLSHSASVGYLHNPSTYSKVVGVEQGKTALQLGAGISVPLGTNSSIFADANADIRSKATSLNGSIGYRYNF